MDGGNSKYTKIDKTKKIRGKTYQLYKLGKWYYVRQNSAPNGKMITLSTELRRNGYKPY